MDNKDNNFESKEYWRLASWTTGYVIDEKLSIFLPHIRKILNAEYLDEKKISRETDGKNISSVLANPPTLTKAALSSVASKLAAAPVASLPNESDEGPTILKLIEKLLRQTDWRARLLEAISRVENCEESLALLRRELGLIKKKIDATGNGDTPYIQDLVYVTKSLCEIEPFLEGDLRLSLLSDLKAVWELCNNPQSNSDLWLVTRRLVYKELSKIRDGQEKNVAIH